MREDDLRSSSWWGKPHPTKASADVSPTCRVGLGPPCRPQVALYLALLAIAWPGLAREPAEPPAKLTVELSPSEGLTVGDRVEAQLVLAWTGPEPVAPPRFPTWGETWGSAEVLAL